MKKIFGIIALILSLFAFYQIATFKLFDEEIKLLKSIEVPNKNYKIKIYFIPGNATLGESIQFRKAEDNTENTLQNYNGYNFLNSYFLKEDTLFIKISDTSKIMNAQNFKILLPKN